MVKAFKTLVKVNGQKLIGCQEVIVPFDYITLSTSIVYARLQLLSCMHHMRLDVLQFWSVIFEFT